MPFNLYTFILSDKLANEEFNKRNVPNPDSARRTALIASFLGPADGGGINAAVIPAVIARESARREAETTAAQRQSELEKSLVPYPGFIGEGVGKAREKLAENFTVKVTDQDNKPFDSAKSPTTPVATQDPDPKQNTTLAKGAEVKLGVIRT